jgi:hypothetical protein
VPEDTFHRHRQPDRAAISVDAAIRTHHDSPDGVEEFIPTIKRTGGTTFPLVFLPSDSTRCTGGRPERRFWFRLTLAPGHRSVAACQRAVSSREFTEWLTYYRLEPFGAETDDHRMAQLMALIANVNRDPKRRKTPWTPDDFLPSADPVRRPRSRRPGRESTPRWRRSAVSGGGDEPWCRRGDVEVGQTPRPGRSPR